MSNLPSFVTVGRGTYWADLACHRWGSETISIGNYCSIALQTKLLAGGGHRRDTVSTFPFDVLMRGVKTASGEDRCYEHGNGIEIGSDVHLGFGCTVMGHVKIGHGAVIAANATVFTDIPPYAIAVGNPARVTKYRFAEDEIQELLGIAWWNWDEATIKARVDDFYLPIRGFCRKYGSLSGFAICPECARSVVVRGSDCPCADCGGTLYFADHDHDGVQCFGSGHGVKQPETVHA